MNAKFCFPIILVLLQVKISDKALNEA